jgi:hypothetical protein
MSEKKATPANAAAAAAADTVDYSKFVPKGFEKVSSDVVGYWDRKIQPVIDFTPKEVVLFDSSQDKKKYSALIIGQLQTDATLVNAEKEPFECKSGETIGVWYANGMKDIVNLGGCRVVMWQQGEKKLKGRPANQAPMKCYEIRKDPKSKPAKLLVTADRRDDSADTETPFDVPAANATVDPF